jgi:electron transport complex protein RnfD
MAFLGGVVAAGLGKLVWGGLGQNLFNPALVGRTFLSAAFPSAMTTWSAPGDAHGFFHVHATNLAPPFLHVEPDALTAATPLGLMRFQHQATGAEPLALGGVAGSLGETSAVLILLGGVYLALRRDIDWRVPVGILLAVALFTGSLHLVDPVRYPGALFSLFSGGLLFGAVFMATDPVTSPLTPRGTWIFALGIGALVVLIRNFGGFPEGVMYAILLMNAATPLIERYTQPRVFGRGGRRP